MNALSVQRARRHQRTWLHFGVGYYIREHAHYSNARVFPRPVVAKQVMQAGSPVEPLRVFAVAARFHLRSEQAEVITHVGNEHVQVNVSVIVSNGKAHPVAGLVYSHRLGYGRETHISGRGVVAKHIRAMSVICRPQVLVSVIVVIEE